MITGQSPRISWRKKLSGVKRTIEAAKEIVAKHGIDIPQDVDFFEDEDGDLDENTTARGPRITKRVDAIVYWEDLVHDLTGKVPFLIRSDILESDDAIVGVFAHELFELEKLRRILKKGKTTSLQFMALTSSNNPGNLHDQAWDFSDAIVRRIQGEPS